MALQFLLCLPNNFIYWNHTPPPLLNIDRATDDDGREEDEEEEDPGVFYSPLLIHRAALIVDRVAGLRREIEFQYTFECRGEKNDGKIAVRGKST